MRKCDGSDAKLCSGIMFDSSTAAFSSCGVQGAETMSDDENILTHSHTAGKRALNVPTQGGAHGLRGRPSRRAARGGFTLLEVSLAMVILAVGVLALIEAQGYFFRVNEYSSQSATGNYLANELRERIRKLPKHDPVTGLWLDGTTLRGWGPEANEPLSTDWDDVDDFDGAEFGDGATTAGPVNSRMLVIPEVDVNGAQVLVSGNPIGMRGWRQRVIIEKVEPFDLGTVVAKEFQRAPGSGVVDPRAVNQFSLRVTVIVTYRSPLDDTNTPFEISRITWVQR